MEMGLNLCHLIESDYLEVSNLNANIKKNCKKPKSKISFSK